MNYHGIIPPMITPLLSPDTLDVAGLHRLVEHLLGGGVQGLFLLGTNGEGPGLRYPLRQQLIEHTCRIVANRIPVLVCITDTVMEQALQVAKWAADAGAEAVVAAPPYYWTASQPDLLHYFQSLASRSPLPLLLYNMPSRTQNVIQPETIRAAMEHPRILGLKDSSCSLPFLHQILEVRGARSPWPVFVGDEETLPYAIQAGAQGGVNGGANVFPRLLVRYYEASLARNAPLLEQLRAIVIRLGALYRITPDSFAGTRGIKAALALRGICSDTPTFPFQRLNEAQRTQISLLLSEIDALQSALP
jgi:dihydrodipicolinate synthase/N-acetylneuraminate lyase